jgi:cholinesterase
MLFGTHPNFRGESTEAEYETSHAMQGSWLAFAKDGPKGLEVSGWEEYTTTVDDDSVRKFGADGVPAEDVSLAEMVAKCSGSGIKE